MTAVIPMLRGGRWRVQCDEHGLDRTVETEAHAENIRALHDRIDHHAPVSAAETIAVHGVDLTAAARWLLVTRADIGLGPSMHHAALGLWTELTGLDDARAIQYAEDCAAAANPVTAHLPPF